MTVDQLTAIETPAVVVDEATVEQNLSRMAVLAKSRGLGLVPHTKTHKSPYWAGRQEALGASRLMVAKLGEAEGLLQAGFHRLYIGYPLVGDDKRRHLVRLIRAGLEPLAAVDSLDNVELLAAAAEETGQTIPFLMEVDTGYGRCGLGDDDAIVALARRGQERGLSFRGLTCFGGHIGWRHPEAERPLLVAAENRRLAACRAALERAGLSVEVVSEGGTPLTAYADQVSAATELRPGTYIYHDVATVKGGAASWADCAAVALTTVVSTPARDRAILDAGSKTLAGDGPIDESYGRIRERPDLIIRALSEEHGTVTRRDGGPVGLRVGDRLTVVPNHVCTMINLHDTVQLLRSDGHIDGLPVALRGAVR